MMKHGIALTASLLFVVGCRTAASPSSPKAAIESQKAIYIPKDLDDCFVQLKKLLKNEDIEKFRGVTEDDLVKYHFGLGMWMRNSWGLWGQSRLATWFQVLGIDHADDMSSIILTSFWRHLNAKPIQLNEQVSYYLEYWKKIKKVQQGAPAAAKRPSR